MALWLSAFRSYLPPWYQRRIGPLSTRFLSLRLIPPQGEMGVAAQTHWFAVGGEVPWAEAGNKAVELHDKSWRSA